MKNDHIPVLRREVLDFLKVERGKKYIDATLGGGGHTELILKNGGSVMGIEADPDILESTKERLKNYCPTLLLGNFVHIERLAREHGYEKVDGVLFDLGISMLHYSSVSRGFSYKRDSETLDMRIDPTTSLKACDLLNILPEDKLSMLFEGYLSSPKRSRLIKTIVSTRKTKRFSKVRDLSSLLGHSSAAPVFLALRVAVNNELISLETAIPQAFSLLKTSGRVAVISFHSLEDKKVYEILKAIEKTGRGIVLTKKPVVPGKEEFLENISSRSSLMRVIEKI